MIYGKIVRSPHPHARIVVDRSVRGAKAPGRQGGARRGRKPGAQVMYQGDPVAAVAADTEEQAIDAARLVKVQYERAAARRQRSSRRWPPTRRRSSIASGHGGNPRKGNVDETGDLDAGFKAGRAHRRSRPTHTHVITHVCMETHGCVCEWDGDKLTAWVSTQGVHGTAATASRRASSIPQRQRPRHHAVHGRRLRQQVRPRRAGPHLREARAGGQGAGQAVRSIARKSISTPATVRRRTRRSRPASRPTACSRRSTRRAGARAARARRRASRCRTSTSSRTAGGTHTDVYINAGQQRADARAGPSAGLLPHRNPDGRARGSRPDGSGRVPHQEPADRGAEPRRGATTCRRARRRSAGTSVIRPAIRRPGRSRPASACRPISGAAAAAAAARTATSRPTAASS